MEKNLHNIDEVFSDAHERFVEQAPVDGWEKLQAGLDKKDADKYKRRFIGWKRVAILLFLLLSGFIIYETGIVKTYHGNNQNAGTSTSSSSNNSFVKPNSIPLNNSNDNLGKNKSHDEERTEFATRINPDSQMKNLFSSKSTHIDSFSYSPDESFSVIGKNKVYKKQKTKISIRSTAPAQEDELNNVTTDETVADIDNNNSQKQPGEKDEMLKTKMLRRELPEKIKLASTETKAIMITPGMLSKPALPLLMVNAEKNPSKLQKKNFNPYWTVTPFASNDWGMYQLDNDVQDNTGNNQNEKDAVSKRERHESSYSAGLTATRQFSKHIGIKTGVAFSNTAIAISPEEIYAVQQNGQVAYKYITSSGYGLIKPGFGLPPAVGDSLRSAEAQHNLQVVSIPLSVSYRIDKKKFSVIPSAGVAANFITSAKVKTEVSDALNKETVNITGLDGMKRFYTSFVADINFQYNLNNKLAFNVLPSFKYALSPITKNNVVKTFPYSFGIGAGLTFKF